MSHSNNYCHVSFQIAEHCNQPFDEAPTSAAYMECAESLVGLILQGEPISWGSHELTYEGLLGDYQEKAFTELDLLMKGKSMDAQNLLQQSFTTEVVDSIYQACLTHESFPDQYNYEDAA